MVPFQKSVPLTIDLFQNKDGCHQSQSNQAITDQSVFSFVAQIADVSKHVRPLQQVFQSINQTSDLGNDSLIVISYVLCKKIFTGCFVKDSSTC